MNPDPIILVLMIDSPDKDDLGTVVDRYIEPYRDKYNKCEEGHWEENMFVVYLLLKVTE